MTDKKLAAFLISPLLFTGDEKWECRENTCVRESRRERK